MDDKNNPNLTTPEATNEPGSNFDGILNNAPPTTPLPPVFVPNTAKKPLDRVKEIPRRSRSWERDR
jgi:hypothetical protein